MPTQTAIQDWLVNQIAQILYLNPSEIDLQAPFSSLGLSSRDAVLLSGDLEEYLERRLSPTLIYEYPSIEALARFLSGEETQLSNLSTLGEPDPSQLTVGAGAQRPIMENRDGKEHRSGQSIDSSLSRLEELSEAEAEALLLEKLSKRIHTYE